MDAIVSFSSEPEVESVFFSIRNYSFFGKRIKFNSLGHSYKPHGSGLAPWLPGHSQLSMKPPLQALEGFMVFLFGALCYTVCTMKAHGSGHGPTHGSGLTPIKLDWSNRIVADHSQL